MSDRILELKKEYTVTEGKVYINTEKPFVIVDTEKEGIMITPADEPVKNRLCYALNYKSRAIYLPCRLMRAYNIERTETAYYLEDGRIFIPKEQKSRIKPLSNCLVRNLYNTDLSCRGKKDKVAHNGHISLREEESRYLGLDIKIEIVNGDRQYIRLSKAAQEELNELPTFEMLRREYGTSLLMYPYDTIQYIVNKESNNAFTRNGHISSFILPTLFIRAWDCDTENHLALFKQKDGSIVLTPQKICYIDKKELPTANEKPIEKTVCEHCYDPEENPNELKEAIRMIKEISGICKKLNEENKRVKEENEKLNQRVKNIESIFKFMNERFS